MLLRLHRLRIALESADSTVSRAWAGLFEGWLADPVEDEPVQIALRLTLVPALPSLPSAAPLFDDSPYWPDGVGLLRVFAADDGVILHYVDGALVHVPLPPIGRAAAIEIDGVITPEAFTRGRFEDVTLTSLAPALRRHGYFLLHAFAAARDGAGVLICGPSHSGKTTTGLNMLLGGWQLLANDAVLLEQRDGVVFALPTPGNVGIRRETFALLPELAGRLHVDGMETIDLPAARLAWDGWGQPARISTLLFPELNASEPGTAERLQPAVALARTMAESVDRWDVGMIDGHIALLESLCLQSAAFSLRPDREMIQVRMLIDRVIARMD